jgi:DNA (cytosine-5)-methyltransferase 3A
MKPMGLFGYPESIIQQPKDKGILLKDILENEVDEKYFLSEKMINYINRTNFNQDRVVLSDEFKSTCLQTQRSVHIKIDKEFNGLDLNSKSCTIKTSGNASASDKHNWDLIVHNTMPRSSTTGKGGTGHLSRNDGKTYCLDTGNTNAVELRNVKQINPSLESAGKQPYQQNRVYDIDGISPALQAQLPYGSNIINTSRIRRLTPIECERLQTVADNYTAHVSDSQRYRMLGNGWTIDVICHIFSYIK